MKKFTVDIYLSDGQVERLYRLTDLYNKQTEIVYGDRSRLNTEEQVLGFLLHNPAVSGCLDYALSVEARALRRSLKEAAEEKEVDAV